MGYVGTVSFLYYFAACMLGHFVGDYLLQNQWMATQKSQPGMRGHIACTVHVIFYTFAIWLFTQVGNPVFLLVVAVPHWIIDRWSLANYFLTWKNGYSNHDAWEKAPLCAQPADNLLERNVWKIAFAAPVYIFNDNTFHWICLWFTVKYFFGS